MAIGIMTVGSVGILALQQASTRGNIQARQISTATNVTRTWIERIRRDGLRWNRRGMAGVTAGPNYLSGVPAPPAVGDWFTPVPAPGATESYAADYHGTDTTVVTNMVYCTNARLRWVTAEESIRVDVRTWYHRLGGGSDQNMSDRRLFAGCAPFDAAAVTAELAGQRRLRAVYASTLVRWSPTAP